MHYCVTNMPGAVGRTSTQALCHATQPYVLRLANEGIVPRKDAEQAAADLARARNDAVTAQRAQQLSVLRSCVMIWLLVKSNVTSEV